MTATTPHMHLTRVLLIRNAFTYDFGGGERFPVQLAAELARHDFEPIVVSRSPMLLGFADTKSVAHIKGWWWSKQNWSGKNTILVPLYLLWQIILIGWYLILIARLKPAVVHPQSKDDFVAATIAGKILKKRIIWTDHADLKYIFQKHRLWYKNPVGKLVYYCSTLADAITLVSHSEAALIQKELGRPLQSNYTVVHNGVVDSKPTPHARNTGGKDSLIFCATSRLVAAKGIGELIDAFTRLQPLYPSCRLWLVGDGPDRGRFEAQAAGNSSIIFFGHSDDPLSYVATADIFIHPSYHEGFSISLVEATMLGKPVIACAVGGNTEIINPRNGILVAPGNSDELGDAMRTLVTSPALMRRLGVGARRTYESGFDFADIVKERFVPLYES